MRRHSRLLRAMILAWPCIAVPGPAAARATPVQESAARQLVSVDPVIVAEDGDAPVMRVTFPAGGTRLPLVILSHGNRLSRGDYQPLVTALAQAGYAVVQPDHPDASVDGFAPKAPQPDDSWSIRVEQIRWIAAHAGLISRQVPGLAGRVDADRIALIGHSFGGHSVAIAMGAKVEGEPAFPPIEGVDAAVMLAPPGHYDGLTAEWKARAAYLRTDWGEMRGPALVINGDSDMTPLTDQGPKWHDSTFTRTPAGRDICLMVVKDAGHYLGGIDSVLRPPSGDATPEKRGAVLGAIVTFLGARLDHRSQDEARWTEIRKTLACK